jgi:hypothetical protein
LAYSGNVASDGFFTVIHVVSKRLASDGRGQSNLPVKWRKIRGRTRNLRGISESGRCFSGNTRRTAFFTGFSRTLQIALRWRRRFSFFTDFFWRAHHAAGLLRIDRGIELL